MAAPEMTATGGKESSSKHIGRSTIPLHVRRERRCGQRRPSSQHRSYAAKRPTSSKAAFAALVRSVAVKLVRTARIRRGKRGTLRRPRQEMQAVILMPEFPYVFRGKRRVQTTK
jgi:hypothetical protein